MKTLIYSISVLAISIGTANSGFANDQINAYQTICQANAKNLLVYGKKSTNSARYVAQTKHETKSSRNFSAFLQLYYPVSSDYTKCRYSCEFSDITYKPNNSESSTRYNGYCQWPAAEIEVQELNKLLSYHETKPNEWSKTPSY